MKRTDNPGSSADIPAGGYKEAGPGDQVEGPGGRPGENEEIWIPIQLNNPESERETVHYGAELAVDRQAGIVLPYFKAAAPPNDALYKRGEKELDPAELAQARDEIILDTLVGYQTEIYQTHDPPPRVSYRIFSIPEDSFEELNSELREGSLIVFSKDNLLPESFTWIDRVNAHILNSDHTPVLLHTPGREFVQLKKVVFGISESHPGLHTLQKMNWMFQRETTEIIVLCMTRDLDTGQIGRWKNELDQFKSRTGFPHMRLNTMIMREPLSPVNLTRSFAIDREADLIALPRKLYENGRGFIRPDSLYEDIHASDIPLLIC